MQEPAHNNLRTRHDGWLVAITYVGRDHTHFLTAIFQVGVHNTQSCVPRERNKPSNVFVCVICERDSYSRDKLTGCSNDWARTRKRKANRKKNLKVVGRITTYIVNRLDRQWIYKLV